MEATVSYRRTVKAPVGISVSFICVLTVGHVKFERHIGSVNKKAINHLCCCLEVSKCAIARTNGMNIPRYCRSGCIKD